MARTHFGRKCFLGDFWDNVCLWDESGKWNYAQARQRNSSAVLHREEEIVGAAWVGHSLHGPWEVYFCQLVVMKQLSRLDSNNSNLKYFYSIRLVQDVANNLEGTEDGGLKTVVR